MFPLAARRSSIHRQHGDLPRLGREPSVGGCGATGRKRSPPAQGTVTSKNPAPLRGQLLFLLRFFPTGRAWTRVTNEAGTRQLSGSLEKRKTEDKRIARA